MNVPIRGDPPCFNLHAEKFWQASASRLANQQLHVLEQTLKG
jgi:hypothetical protein